MKGHDVPPIACVEVREALDEILAGSTEHPRRDELKAHLAACDPCRRRAFSLRQAAGAIWSLGHGAAGGLLPRHVLARWRVAIAGPRVVLAAMWAAVCAVALAASPHLVETSSVTMLAVLVASSVLFAETWAALERPFDDVFSARAVAWGLALAVGLSCAMLGAVTIPRPGLGSSLLLGAMTRSAILSVAGVVFAVGLGMGLLLGRVSLANMGALLICYAALMLPTLARVSPLLFDPRDLGFWMALLSLVGLAGAFLGEIARDIAGPAMARMSLGPLVLAGVKGAASDNAR